MPKNKQNNNFGYISLQEATKLCPYSQEYLSLRARQGKLKSVKLGRNWVTTKEWLKEYLEKVEQYQQLIDNQGTKNDKQVLFHSPPGNLPVRHGLELNINWGALGSSFVAVLIFALFMSAGVFGKDRLLQTYRDAITHVENVSQNINGVADEMLLATVNYQDALAALPELLKEYADWVRGSYGAADTTIDEKVSKLFLALIPESIVRTYTASDQFLDAKIKDITRGYIIVDRALDEKISTLFNF
jgi:hypothetical protein